DLVERETGSRKVADDAVWFLLLCPVGFFFSIFYTEGLFVFLAVACVACARRGRFGSAAVLCAVASATKTVGVVLMVPLALEVVVRVRDKRVSPAALLWLLVAPAGLLAYMADLHDAFGIAFAFVEAERAWGRGLATPFKGLWRLRSHSVLD